jgi:intein/homing endonuclease
MAYVLGFFAADGYITVNKRGGQFWCIQITDRDLLENIKEVIKAEHKISIRFPNKNKPNESILYRIQIGSIEMCDDLRKLGFLERKTKNLVIPNIPNKYFPNFVRGYFDGDGNIWQGEIHKERKTKHKVLKLSFTSCSYEFLEKLQNRLYLFGIEGGCIYKSKKKQFFRLQFSTGDALKLYNFMYNSSIQENKLFLNRKKVVFEKYMRLRL